MNNDNSRRNHILDLLPVDLADVIVAVSRTVIIPANEFVSDVQQIASHVYFPTEGVASIEIGVSGRVIEIGKIGREGMVGGHVAFGIQAVSSRTIVQSELVALEVSASKIVWAFERDPMLRKVFHCYAEVSALQYAESALAHGLFTVVERVARWILMFHDRSDDDELVVTHSMMAGSLGVRRAGISTALQSLEAAGALRSSYANVHVLDRKILLHFAGNSYGLVENEYNRLLRPAHGPFRFSESIP